VNTEASKRHLGVCISGTAVDGENYIGGDGSVVFKHGEKVSRLHMK
jgi:hypothetical protein